jgi:hypothetical protein
MRVDKRPFSCYIVATLEKANSYQLTTAFLAVGLGLLCSGTASGTEWHPSQPAQVEVDCVHVETVVIREHRGGETQPKGRRASCSGRCFRSSMKRRAVSSSGIITISSLLAKR